MSVWWLAINVNDGHCSYPELKKRKVIAQGWPDIGDVGYVRRMPLSHVEDELRRKLTEKYEFKESLPRRLLALLCRIEPGDLVVGIEGTRAEGVCKMLQGFSYRYDPDCNYAHTLGPVEWADWQAFSPNWRPTAPARAVLAVAQMNKSASQVERLAREFWRQA